MACVNLSKAHPKRVGLASLGRTWLISRDNRLSRAPPRFTSLDVSSRGWIDLVFLRPIHFLGLQEHGGRIRCVASAADGLSGQLTFVADALEAAASSFAASTDANKISGGEVLHSTSLPQPY